MSLEDHPGYLGITSRGVIAIQADWPMYPEEHSADLALLWLTAFPQGTPFKPIDDIDCCNLFLADVKYSNRADPFDERNLHVAVWHEDLLQLRDAGFVEGVSPVSERRWRELERAALPQGPLYIKLKDGTFKEVELPSLDEYTEDDASWPEYSPEGLVVTASGRSHVASLLAKAPDDLAILGQRIPRLVEMGFFDTAVREACVGLEHHLKTWLQSNRWGDALVEEVMLRLREKDNYINTYMRTFRGQMRTAFKFIRNDFMHNFIEVDETQCRAVLVRLARLQGAVNQVTTSV